MHDEIHGDTVNIHVNSKAYAQPQVAALDAVRQAITQLEIQTGRVFPDYHYFKLKVLDERVPDTKLHMLLVLPVSLSTRSVDYM